MSKIITLSDDTYEQLQRLAEKSGRENVERYLAGLWEAELHRRQELGHRIDDLRERIFAKHGYLGDSTELIREDRER